MYTIECEKVTPLRFDFCKQQDHQIEICELRDSFDVFETITLDHMIEHSCRIMRAG